MDKIFIEQAKSIRKEYIKNVKEVVKCESKVEEYKSKLIEIQEELKSVDFETAKLKLHEIEKNIKSVETILSPYTKKIEELEANADTLFEKIKERHPNLTMEEIQNELIPYLMEIEY